MVMNRMVKKSNIALKQIQTYQYQQNILTYTTKWHQEFETSTNQIGWVAISWITHQIMTYTISIHPKNRWLYGHQVIMKLYHEIERTNTLHCQKSPSKGLQTQKLLPVWLGIVARWGSFWTNYFSWIFFQNLRMSFFWCCCLLVKRDKTCPKKQSNFVGNERVFYGCFVCFSYLPSKNSFFIISPWPFLLLNTKHLTPDAVTYPMAVEKKVKKHKIRPPLKSGYFEDPTPAIQVQILQLDGLMILRAPLSFRDPVRRNLLSMTLGFLCDHLILLLQSRACIAHHPCIRV